MPDHPRLSSLRTRRDAAVELLDIPFCPLVPTPRQTEFLLDLGDEALYGGAAGGGKSVALLMAALQFVEIPGYAALILRPTLTESSLPSGLMNVANEWLATGIDWSRDDHRWTFPSGATLSFGFLASASDPSRYQGAEFQFIGFDELTQFDEASYLFLFSRLRRPNDPDRLTSRVPLRMRGATNPGGRGHDWVRQRFIEPWQAAESGGPHPERAFYPSRIKDNPYLDAESYSRSLNQLGPVARAQLLEGNWDIRPEGRLFNRDWFMIVSDAEVPDDCRWVRYWDLAATAAKPGTDPDYTVGALVGHDGHNYYLCDIVRLRATPHEVEKTILRTAENDGHHVEVHIEQEPGGSGIAQIEHYRTQVLDGYTTYGDPPKGSKVVRAEPVAAAHAEAGDLRIVRGGWNSAFLDEAEIFPDGTHDDQVDALAGALAVLAKPRWRPTPAMPGGETRVSPLEEIRGTSDSWP